MNCKPGDMAIVMRGLSGPNSSHTGMVVTVVRASGAHPAFGPCWHVEIGRPVLFYATTRNGRMKAPTGLRTEGDCPDAWLKPIRPVGDDEVDEVLALTGKPIEAAPQEPARARAFATKKGLTT